MDGPLGLSSGRLIGGGGNRSGLRRGCLGLGLGESAGRDACGQDREDKAERAHAGLIAQLRRGSDSRRPLADRWRQLAACGEPREDLRLETEWARLAEVAANRKAYVAASGEIADVEQG